MNYCYRGDHLSRLLLRGLVSAFLLSILTTATWSQTTAGSIHGLVTDPSGAAVPQAHINVTNKETQEERSALSTEAGTYTVPSVAPGTYRVTASLSGFRTGVVDTVRVPVNSAVTVNFSLQVGDVTEQIEVTAGAAALLQTTDSTIGEVVDHEKVVQLPLNGRQFTQLVLLTPGAAYKESGQQGLFNIKLGAGGISPSVNGQNFHHNNFTMDGLENNARFDNTYAIAPPPDAIEEFKVQSHIADARFGLAPGANINVVSKSGTSEFHGTLWEFLRNDKLDARNFFDLDKIDASGRKFAPTKPPFQQNQYGVAFGGPVIFPGYDGRNGNTYFFGYWEGFRSRKGFTRFSSVPTPAELKGDFSALLRPNVIGKDPFGRDIPQGTIFDPTTGRQVGNSVVREPFPGNIIPTSRIDSSALFYAQAMFPTPNYGGGSLPVLPNLIWGQSRAIDSDQWGVRIDHRFRNNDTLFGRVNMIGTNQINPGALPTVPTDQDNISKSMMVGYTRLFSPTFIANFKFGYLRTRIPISPRPAGTDLVNRLNFSSNLRPAFDFADKGTTVGPNIAIAPRITSVSQYGWGLGNPDYNYQYNFDVAKVYGTHTMSAGVELMHWRHLTGVQPQVNENFDPLATNEPTTRAGGDGLASYLLGLPTGASQFGFNPTNIWGKIYIIFLQDDWKVTPRLTMNLGLQYDYAQRPRFLNDEISTADLELGIYRVAKKNPFTGDPPNVRKTLFDPDWNNFAPRVGIAYRVARDTVIRTGFGIYYAHSNELIQEGRDSTSQWPWGPLINQNAVNLNNELLSGRTFRDPLPPLGDLKTPPPANFGINVSKFRDPYSQQWNFGIQHALSSSLSLNVDYVGSSNHKLFIQPTANVARTPGPGNFKLRQPFPQFNPGAWDTHIGNSNYESLQLKLTKRYSQGLSFLASYTWGRAFDIGTTRGTQAQNFFDLRDSYGPSDYDVPQHFVFSYVYDVPFGLGKQFGGGASRAADLILGNWQLGGIIRFSQGTPFSIGAPFDVANVGGGTQRASILPGQKLLPDGFKQTPDQWFNSAAVTIVPFTFGNLSRNVIRGPGINQWDFGLFKFFKVTESKSLEFRTEFFNAWNRAQLASPTATATNPNLGRIFSTAFDPREIQFGLKFKW